MSKTKEDARLKRKRSIRKRVYGSSERPRMSVFRSAKHIYVQVVDDDQGRTLVAASSLETAIKSGLSGLKKKDFARRVGGEIAKRCLSKGIDKVVFDRNGYIYHGRISALADGAREAGLKF